MPKLVIASHNLNSSALKNLSDELSTQLGYKVWRKKPTEVRPNQHAVTFQKGIDKVEQFASFHREGVPAPLYATSLADAGKLECRKIVVRQLTASSEGRGISIVDREALDTNAPLYTEYIPKKKEYRVHVFDNKVVDVQEKRRKRGREGDVEFQVRNTANGYVFCREAVNPPTNCTECSLAAVASLGRTYGAVDVIYNEKRDKCYVLEVNSRPGMEGTTVKKYASAIIESLPADVRNLPVRSARSINPIRADGKRMVVTLKGNRVWR